ncbi:MAG: STAS domain-containing protein [Phycisphaerae bacterium]
MLKDKEKDAAPIKLTRDGELTVVEFNVRKLLEENEITEMGRQLTSYIENQLKPKIIISFAGVDHLSSSALGTLITVNYKVRERDGQLRLCSINPQIYEVFLITKLNKLFRIFPTMEEAKASLEKPSS